MDRAKTYRGNGSLAVGEIATEAFYVFTVTRTTRAIDGNGQVVASADFLRSAWGGPPVTLALSGGSAFPVILTRISGDRADFAVADGVPEDLCP